MIWMFLSCIGSVKETGELPPWIDIPSYRQANLSTDMFPTHQPEEVACPANGFRVEVNQLEIQTDICNYAVVEWVTQHDVPAKTTLEALVLHVPPPTGKDEDRLRSLIVDSWFDSYVGVVIVMRVMDGVIKKGDRIILMESKAQYEVNRVGVFAP